MESNPANLRPPYFLLCLCLVFFTLMTTGSILSPDSEIVYRVGESIANSGTFSLDHELEGWPGFGTARGIDGKIYSVFGPLESIILAPCIKIAGFIDQTGWYNAVPALIPLSYHIDAGLQRRFYHQPATRLEPHAVRFLVSFLNVIVSLLCVYVFWRIVMNLVRDRTIAVISSIVYAFGTMMWNYSGSLFSEPLATLFVLASLDAAVSIDTQQVPEPGYGKSALLSGLYLGLAVAAHLSAILFIPFFAGYVIWTVYRRKGNISAGLQAAIFWTVGCGLILLLLGYYNVIRFGNWFETGRGVNPNAVRQFGYGEFVAPWQGLWGLLVSPSKGIFIYSPALVLGLIGWRKLHRSWKSLSWMLLLALAFRLIFIATRSDWHGGFCLGPRYLLMALPLCLIPAAVWLKEYFNNPRPLRLAALCGLVFLFISEQIYFCVGEVFSSYHLLTFYSNTHKINPFKDNDIYLSATYAPIIHLYEGWRGAAFLEKFQISNWGLCFIGIGLVYVFCTLALMYFLRAFRMSGAAIADPTPQETSIS